MYSLQYTLYRYTDLTTENFLPLYTFFVAVGLEELYAYSKRKICRTKNKPSKVPYDDLVGHNF